MTNWIERAVLKRLSTVNSEQYGWLYSISQQTPGVFWKFVGFAPLATHRKRVDNTLLHLTRLGAMQVYDCGSCLQIAVDTAAREGLDVRILRAALTRPLDLAFDERLALDFGAAVARNDKELVELVPEVRARLGEAALAELALSAATAAVLPTLKRGLGIARTCLPEQLRFGSVPTATRPEA